MLAALSCQRQAPPKSCSVPQAPFRSTCLAQALASAAGAFQLSSFAQFISCGSFCLFKNGGEGHLPFEEKKRKRKSDAFKNHSMLCMNSVERDGLFFTDDSGEEEGVGGGRRQ